jgi:transposase
MTDNNIPLNAAPITGSRDKVKTKLETIFAPFPEGLQRRQDKEKIRQITDEAAARHEAKVCAAIRADELKVEQIIRENWESKQHLNAPPPPYTVSASTYHTEWRTQEHKQEAKRQKQAEEDEERRTRMM